MKMGSSETSSAASAPLNTVISVNVVSDVCPKAAEQLSGVIYPQPGDYFYSDLTKNLKIEPD